MQPRRLVVLGVLLSVVIALMALGRRGGARGATYVPSRDDDVLEHTSATSDPRRAEMSALRKVLRARPDDLASALRFTVLAIEEGRARSDPRYLGYGQAALSPWWDQPAPPATVRLLRATIRQSLHDFAPALLDLDAVVAEDPKNAQAWLTRSVILTVRGDYAEARKSCLRVSELASAVIAAVCTGSIDGVTGHAREGIARIEGALAAGATDGERGWAIGALAELSVRAGDRDAAGRRFVEALAIDPRDPYLLATYADLLLDGSKHNEVIEHLRGSLHDDGLLLRVVLAETALKHPAAAAHLDELRARHAANRARGDIVHRREAARFELWIEGHPAEALALARANWEVQREPADARILLEAADAAHDPAAAAPVVAWVRSSGIEDPTLRALAARCEAK